MKQLFIALCLLFMLHAAQAQLEKGNWVLGGGLSFSSNTFDEAKTKNFGFNPSVGIILGSGFVGGINFQVNSIKIQDESPVNNALVGPFIKSFLAPPKGAVNFFLLTSYGWGSTNAFEDKRTQKGFSFGAGPTVFLSRHSAMELSLNYSSVKIEGIEERNNTLNLSLGFQVYLGKKEKK